MSTCTLLLKGGFLHKYRRVKGLWKFNFAE